jgi:anti-sigma factor RsiW
LIEAYMDGELDPAQRSGVEAHLKTCKTCEASLTRLRRISEAIHAQALSYEATAELEDRVTKSIQQEAFRRPSRAPAPFWAWAAVAACVVLSLALAWTLRANRAGGSTIAQEVISDHVRSLMGGHLMDVPSTDRHTVKPWFAGKLDFSPDVKDLATEGFRLIGGRLDYLNGHPVAALIFQHQQHVVNLFTWPQPGNKEPPTVSTAQNGYNAIHWSANGMTYWAVADMPPATLQEFAHLYE